MWCTCLHRMSMARRSHADTELRKHMFTLRSDQHTGSGILVVNGIFGVSIGMCVVCVELRIPNWQQKLSPTQATPVYVFAMAGHMPTLPAP